MGFDDRNRRRCLSSDGGEDFLSVNRHLTWGFNTQSYLVTSDFDDRDHN